MRFLRKWWLSFLRDDGDPWDRRGMDDEEPMQPYTVSPAQLELANRLAAQVVPEDADGYPRKVTREMDWLLARDAILTALEHEEAGR